MAQNPKELRYATDGDLWIAESGVELPETISDELDAEFANLGYASDEGVSSSRSISTEDIRAWQEADPIDKRVTERGFAISATLLQTNRDVYAATFGGGEWVETKTDEYEYLPPASGDPLPEYSLVVDIKDGDVHDRLIIPRCVVADEVETQYVRNDATKYPLNFTALAPEGGGRAWRFQTNNAHMAPAGS
jgi:hypothetical protein